MLLLLYERETQTENDFHRMNDISKKVRHFAVNCFSEERELFNKAMPPFVPLSLYVAIKVSYWLWSRFGEVHYHGTAASLRTVLVYAGKRWAVAGVCMVVRST